MAYTHFHPLEALGDFFEGIFEFFKLVIILIIIIVIIFKYLKKKKNEGEIGVIPKFIKTKTFRVLTIIFLASLALEYGFSIVKKTINNKSEYTNNSNDYIESDNQTPTVLEEEGHVWHLFVIRTENRNRLQEYLKDNGVQTLIHYPIPVHKQEAYNEFKNLIFPITEEIHRNILSLPIGAHIKKEDIITELVRGEVACNKTIL